MTRKASSGIVFTFFCSTFVFLFLLLLTASGGTVTSSADSGPGTLRQEIADASPGDTIDFDVGITHITLTSGELSLSKSLTIDGDGAVTIDGGGTNRIFNLSGSAYIWSFHGLTLTNGTATGVDDDGRGAGIRYMQHGNASALTISNCAISACSSDVEGGAVYVHVGSASGTVVVCDSIISGNSSVGTGGGIFSRTSLLMDNTIVSNNVAQSAGGVSMPDEVSVNRFNTVTFVANNATGGVAGGVYIERCSVTIADCTFQSNEAANRGGAVFLALYDMPTVVISNSTFQANEANRDSYYDPAGGAILASDALTIESCAFVSNRAPNGPGGALGALGNDANVTVKNCTFSGNSAEHAGSVQKSGGGAVFVYNGATLAIYNSTIYTNTAVERGGGIMIRQNTGGSVSLYSTIVAGNAAESANDMYSYSGGDTFNLDHCIYQNTNGWNAGALVSNITDDPLLLPLADNGGATWTHALPASSPCINAGANPLGLDFDQRGAPYIRDAYGGVDIGAYERWHLPLGTIMVVR